MSKTTKSATVTPLGDRVLVKRVAADDKTKGGIILPDTAKEKPREGIVVAVGNGKVLDTGARQPRRRTACCSRATPAARSSSTAMSC